MLILTDSDCLGLNLHKLRQGILQTSGNRGCAPLSDVEVRELFCRKLTCRIYGCPRFAHYYILKRCVDFFNQFYYYLLRLTGCGTVSE